jgi:hypothetical protein
MTGPVSRYQNDNLELLSALRLLPPDSGQAVFVTTALDELVSADDGTAIEQPLLQLWTQWRRTAPRRQRDYATRVAAWLQSVVEGGGSLTLGIPSDAGRRLRDVCGRRVLFWPHGRPSNSLATITSSRIGRSDAAVATFVEKLQLVLPHVAEARHTLLIVEKTTGADLVHRAARQAGTPVLLGARSADGHPERWLSQLMEADHAAMANEARVLASPRPLAERSTIADPSGNSNVSSPIEPLPLRDRLAIALAETVWNLSVRKAGNLHQLLHWRLQHDFENAASIRLIVAENESVPDHVAELIDRGAVLWNLLKSPDSHQSSPKTETPSSAFEHAPVICAQPNDKMEEKLKEQLALDGEWLIHWTRTATKPLDGSSAENWLNRQLLPSFGEATGPLATLQQILQDGIIRASSDGLRGSKPMTCFSAVPLRELASRRRFQTHRARWDFEPYGLCIRRRTLEALGARPVIYGDDSLWQALPEPERPWFQQRFSGRGKRQIDWSDELEWRVTGDVRLTDFSRDDLVVFCGQQEDVTQLAPACTWPLITLTDFV